MKNHQVTIVFHHDRQATVIMEQQADNEKRAVERALLDLDWDSRYKDYKDKSIKTITVFKIK